MPEPVLDGLARGGGIAWFLASRGQHEAALRNYAAVLRLPPEHPDVRETAVRAFQNYGRMMADFTKVATVGPDELRDRFRYSGTEDLDAALQAGRGAILALPHMGSWDVGGAAVAAYGYDVHAVAERFPGSLDEAVVSTREKFGLRIIPLGRSAVPRLLAVLRANGVVALMTDIAHGAGVEVEMFEHRVTLAAGPASLALRTGAALIPASVWATAPFRYAARAEPELAPERTGDRKRDIRALTQRLAAVFERLIRAHPDQWYAFRPILERTA